MNLLAWNSAVAHVVVLSAALVLAGCGTFEERNFSATQQGTKTQERHDRAGACFGLNRAGIPAPTSPEAGEILVGYENRINRGADPFPCNHRSNYDHQALVQFDTSSYASDDLITAAVLEADVRFIALMPVTEVSRDCRNLFQRATEAWAPGDFRGPAGDPRTHVAAEGSGTWGSGENRLELNVLHIVRRWINRSQPNHGFAFSTPPEHSFAEENLSCVFAFRNWNLRVTRFIPERAAP